MKSFNSGEALQEHFDQVHATEFNDSISVSCNFSCQMSSRYHTKNSKDRLEA